MGDGDDLGERVVVEVVEEIDPAQVGELDGRRGHASPRYWWMSETAIEPSPTALATRVIERGRAAPAAEGPGAGGRRRRRRCRGRSSRAGTARARAASRRASRPGRRG